MTISSRLVAVIYVLTGVCVHAAQEQQLVFSSANVTYGVLVINDRFGQDFVRRFNESLSQHWSPEVRADGSISDMRLLSLFSVQEKANFFVLPSQRASANRYLVYAPQTNADADPDDMLWVRQQFIRTHGQVPPYPEVVASRLLGQVMFAIFLPFASFAFDFIARAAWRQFRTCREPY